MKRKSTSYGDFLKTVMCVQHPKLKSEHRLFLVTIAVHADGRTGRGSYPGMDFLEAANARSWKRVNARAKYCEDLGLIKRVEIGHKGKNTEWDFCLERDAYPDTYPGLVADFGGHDSDDQRSAIGGHFEGDRSSLSHSLVVTLPKIGGQRGDHSSDTPSATPSTPKPGDQDTLDAQAWKELRRVMGRRGGEELVDGKLASTEKQWAAVRELAQDYGFNVVKIVWDAFLKADDVFAGCKYPLTQFTKDFPSYLARIEAEHPSQVMMPFRQHLDLWKVRLRNVADPVFYYGFQDVMTSEELRVFQELKKYTRPEDLLLDKIGRKLERLLKRSEIWAEENKDFIAEQQEQDRLAQAAAERKRYIEMLALAETRELTPEEQEELEYLRTVNPEASQPCVVEEDQQT